MYRMLKRMNPVLLAIAAGLLVGCAHNPDIRQGHDNTFGTTARSPADYLGCVKSELPAHATTYTVQDHHALALFVNSTDPNKADGLVQISGAGHLQQYSAYQRDAWYDHGRLLDAASVCART
jgi:type IV pilus biogenesis protein CpaD/CtpE